MEKNIATTDRIIRLIFGILLMWGMLLAENDLLLSIVLGLVGIYMLITAAIGICTLYSFVGLRSRKRKNNMH